MGSRRSLLGRAMALVVLGLICTTAFAACGGSDDGGGGGGSAGGGKPPASKAGPSAYSAGASISVRNGDTFVIALDANPTTGYSWAAQANPNATFVSSEQVPGGSMPGAPGTQRLTFRATAPGSSTLVLDYARPFEQGVPPVQTQSFPLAVTP